MRENLEVAARLAGTAAARWTAERVYELFPILARPAPPARRPALAAASSRCSRIARTLMGNPDLLLLDEPSEGLAPLVVETLADQLARLKVAGMTILLAEQNVRFVSELGDRVYILEKGMVRYQGSMVGVPRRRAGAAGVSGGVSLRR